ncbi:YL076 protein, partial [Polypterus senegalus]
MQGTPPVQGPTVRDVLHPATIRNQSLLSHHVIKVTSIELGKSIFLGDMNLLSPWKLELGTAQCLNDMLLVLDLGSDRHDHLANMDTSHCSLWLSKCTTHPCLEPISSSTG